VALNALVIGFAGRPVKGSTGWKPALVHDLDTDRYSVEGSSETWNERELKEFEKAGLLSLFPEPFPHRPGFMILYAHLGFLIPSQAETTRLGVSVVDPVLWCPKLESHVAYVAESDALMQWRVWARRLMRKSLAALMSPGSPVNRGHLAQSSALRARFCTAHPMLIALRTRAFALSYAALRVAGFPTEPLALDASLDLTPARWMRVRRRGLALWGLAAHRPRSVFPERLPVDVPAGHSRVREWRDAA